MSCKRCKNMELRYGRSFCIAQRAWMCDRAAEVAPVCARYEEVSE